MIAQDEFLAEVQANVRALAADAYLRGLSLDWLARVSRYRYAHNFTWLGRPIVQCPQDVLALQEIIWRVKPDLIIETGIARGGSLIFYASMLELCGSEGRVVGVDIDIRAHNRVEIEKHAMARRITLIQGSSIDAEVIRQVADTAVGSRRVMVVLDSNHTHSHVLRELQLYAPLVSKESYLVVLDTGIEDMPASLSSGRPWGPGNNPKTAVHEFLATTERFVIDKDIDDKLSITVAPDGYLRCVKELT